MTLFERLRYALYAAAVGGATLSLAIALLSADAIGVLPARAFDWIMSPLYGVAVYVVAFILAPALAERFPISLAHSKEQ
jgi:hypothetical protein